MKHNLRICISKEPQPGGIIACQTVSIREKLLDRLFGNKQKVTILVPGESVETVAITEIPEGGKPHEAIC